tara:strand:+ start:1374 stop:1823 length:450 start_codon:yes stop_codon:yes gene_type:complete
MAEAIGNAYGINKLDFKSAGSQPTGQVNPFCIKALKKRGISNASLRSKSWNEFRNLSTDENSWQPQIIVTLCSKASREECPLWLEKVPKVNWNLEDPAMHINSQKDSQKAFEKLSDTLNLRFKFIKKNLASKGSNNIESLFVQAAVSYE